MSTPEDIAAAPIDPDAEPAQTRQSSVSGKDEDSFYKKSGKEFDLLENQQNLGWLGKFFGSSTSASTNIAGFVILCCFAFLLVSCFFQGNAELTDARKIAFGAISSALSFIFGAASKK